MSLTGEAPGPYRVTIVEDDAAIAEGLALNLRLQGYMTELVGDGETARTRIEEWRPDLVLLDISLPKRSGIWVLEKLREADNHVPVIVLSARQDEFDKVAALHLGADDYVTKPFALAELLARVAAVLRRARLSAARAEPAEKSDDPGDGGNANENGDSQLLRFGDILMDLHTRTVTRAGQDVRMTHREFELLKFFRQSGGRVFSREELVRQVWGLQHAGQARTVDNFVAQLRAKLEDDPDNPKHLLTVRGSGYRFSP
ncbi:MAG TPA: response regulator transcription factor [Polyangia bacterium]|jgi:two-component system alkaline phosphatase synthesis response regulator PhoP|nr:response regulator transcription factor [Polyangia bacterium]